jgi:6-pyruvoyltetrahydropterin/6-carboxytetrahydropterin synthase
MYAVCVRSHMMIAHSFRGDLFGPAQRLHGATYVVDVELRRAELSAAGVVVDIARATDALSCVVEELNFKNLDDEAAFSGKNTTTEFLAKEIFERLAGRIRAGQLGDDGRAIASLRVTLHESHVAWASYEGSLTPSGG